MELYECPRCGPVKPGQILYDGHRCALCTTPLRMQAKPDWRDKRIAELEAEVAEQGRQLATMRSA